MDIPAGQTAPLPVNVSDIQGLYGFEIHLSFDPAVVEVVDADAGTPGIQVKVGDFLAPDFVVLNRADNQTGKIDFGLTQMNPHEAKSGSGTLFTISFPGTDDGAKHSGPNHEWSVLRSRWHPNLGCSGVEHTARRRRSDRSSQP